ncbi:MAG TPA: phosphoribosylanthranilate isomerase [Chryseolinea sp.]
MRDAGNILDVASLGPQYLGFIFYPKSPRFVGSDFKMPSGLPATIKRVGVFVNESNDLILEKHEHLNFDFVQLHGNESPSTCAELKRAGIGIIKVFSVGGDFSFDSTESYKGIADYFLFDTKGKYYGGNAVPFDWKILEQYDQETPFFLSGGLSPENLDTLDDFLKMNIHALDLNSGVETAPGMKDPERIKAILSRYGGKKQ